MTTRRRRLVLGIILVVTTMVAQGCATILGGGTSQAVSVASDPVGARFAIKSSSGLQMASGNAPQAVRLPRKNEYQVEFTAPGYQTQSVVLTKGVNGWIWGNLVLGWIVGFAIDFISGSAYKLEPAQVQIAMVRAADGSGTMQLYGVVRQLDGKGQLINEQRVLMQPTR
jgi:hypothetical protein